jgi:hypothetical protein
MKTTFAFQKSLLFPLAAMAVFCFSLCATPAANAQNAQAVIKDMTVAPDAPLHGTEALNWGDGHASPQPMPVPAKNYKGQWFQAMTSWGQVYIPRAGSPAVNTRCQIRNLVTKLLLKNGEWKTVQSSDAPEGAAYQENFANNASMDAGARKEAANGKGLSVIVGVGPTAGHNFHFWPSGGRATVDVSSVVGVYTSCEARLIKSDPSGPDDRAACKNLLQMGADWWLDKDVGWKPDWSANSGVGSMRSKWVTAKWQVFQFCTLSPSAITVNPPVGPVRRKPETANKLETTLP